MNKRNKYAKWYSGLIAKRQANPLTRKLQYLEIHHITPKSLGGSNEKQNLVLLTPREHFVAHLLLTKMYEGDAKKKMHFAFHSMKRGTKKMERYTLSSHLYEIFVKNIKREVSDETRRKMTVSQKARAPFSKEQCANMSKGIKASYTPELCQLRSTSQKGIAKSTEVCKAMSVFQTARWASSDSVKDRKKLSELASLRRGAAATRSKTWSLLSPTGKAHLTSACGDFCKEQGLSYYGLRNKAVTNDTSPVTRGPSKGWSVLACSEKV